MKNGQKTILIVEDEASLLNALRDRFTHEGFAVLGAKNGVEGLAVATAQHPDLIMLDIVMPVMDGMVMLKKLRSDAWGKGAKVIILSNLSDSKKVADALAQGSYDYLVKSDEKIEDIVAKVKDKLGQSVPRK